ncbi:jg105, partial [Pararge aegeria aegeria]
GVPKSKVLGRLFPAAPSNSFYVVWPSLWSPSNAALTSAGSPFKNLGTPTSIGSPSSIATSALRLAGLLDVERLSSICIMRYLNPSFDMGVLLQNTVISFNYLTLHHDKETWGDPENFRPERFIENGQLQVSKDKSLPFGAGERIFKS